MSLDPREVRNGLPLQVHLNLMRWPRYWQHYPVLPLKRGDIWADPEPEAMARRVGFLRAFPGTDVVEPEVYFGDIYGVLPKPDPESKRYESLEAILEDGWGVD